MTIKKNYSISKTSARKLFLKCINNFIYLIHLCLK